jgi:hypothetical protein
MPFYCPLLLFRPTLRCNKSVLLSGSPAIIDQPDKETEISRSGVLIDFERFYTATKIDDIIAPKIP